MEENKINKIDGLNLHNSIFSDEMQIILNRLWKTLNSREYKLDKYSGTRRVVKNKLLFNFECVNALLDNFYKAMGLSVEQVNRRKIEVSLFDLIASIRYAFHVK